MRRAASVGLLALMLVACRGPMPAPTATPRPTETPTPAPQPLPAAPSEIEDAFLSNIDDLVAEAADLAVTPCADLTMVTNNNPNLMPSIHGFAATLKRVGASQAALDTDAVHAALADLDHTIGELDGALHLCGIQQP